jgi:poly(A) polymerase
MTERLEDQDWLTATSTRAVIAALEARGGRGVARFVGGAVRNAVMGLGVDDVDIATPLTPQAVIEALDAAGLKHVPTGLTHGTVTAIAQRTPFEITTLRRDVSTDGRNATVAFTDDWHEDAMRRDFRLNALYADPDGTIFDPTGEGLADAREGRIVFVGDAETRIREDYLRILRFFRFHAWYGRGEADPTALTACAAQKDGMVRLSAERVWKELYKLLGARDPVPAVRLMNETGVLQLVLPAATVTEQFQAMAQIEDDPLLRLASLLPDDAATARDVASKLRLSNAHRDRLVAVFGNSPPLYAHMTEADGRRAIYSIGWQTFRDRLMLIWAKSPPSPISLLSKLEGWIPPVFPIGGKDVLERGVKPGPRVQQILKEVEEWWVANDFPDDAGLIAGRLNHAVFG